ncbi:hypothetical protein OA93_06025 [Flavobacterium sp. KMS]|uniref:hypothetical protein n=1 Tax=Flavobacterium sp. KMS TaxID=1566023 RepID=UPI00057C5E98|nr:hypothetical protein [Flavobacterium sp. KMS]KIA99186.1 hypothetical protein OA93_06025 [Flavobacterium sp. KMS]
MKDILKIFVIVGFFIQNNSYAQQLVQNTSQVYLLKDNEELFINKPLKDLLKEIKPEIKTAAVFNNEASSLFGFRFTTLAQQRKNEGAIEDRVTLLVFVREFVLWNREERPKGAELNWTPNDAQKFADFIVLDIEVVPTSQN